MMELDTAQSIEVITVSTTSSPGSSVKKVVPLQIDLGKFPHHDKDDNSKLRRPVRPIDRQRMRPWLMELLDLGNVFGLRWTNRHQGIFQISWRHASRLGWNLETDGDVFERWARHTGIYKEGDPPEPKRWKANFRCALHSLHDVVELTNAVERRGRNACRTYRFLQSNDEQSIIRKRAKARRAKELQERPPERYLKLREAIQIMPEESPSSEELLSDSESESSQQDKVIVQKLDIKGDLAGEDYCLQHDHDYAGPDKTQKTIVLRQGVGSIVLHKEVLSAPDDEAQSLLMSNLDQLASAAMSSAGMSSTQPQREQLQSRESKERRSSRTMKQNTPKASTSAGVETGQSRKSEFSLKHLLTGTKPFEDGSTTSGTGASTGRYSTRKRKLSTPLDDSSPDGPDRSERLAGSSGKSEKSKSPVSVASPEKLKRSPNTKQQNQSQPTASPTRHRSGSPKILYRRSQRNRSKSEKNVSESTEPLMSSCLLLLEAATRLDNAEKKGKSVAGAAKSNKGKQSTRDESKNQTGERIKTEEESPSVVIEEDVADEEEDDDVSDFADTPEPSGQQYAQGILRSTLENADQSVEEEGDEEAEDYKSKQRTIRNLLKDSSKVSLFNAISVSDGKIIVTETPYAKGLFSGSKIQSSAATPSDDKKNEKVGVRLRMSTRKRPNPEYDTQTTGSSASVTGSTSEIVISPNISTVKSNSGVQQMVIQRALPVLNPVSQKSGSARLDTSTSPVVIAHNAGRSGSVPQIFVSAGGSVLQPVISGRTTQQESVTVKAEPHVKQKKVSDVQLVTSSSSLSVAMAKQFLALTSGVGQTAETWASPLSNFSSQGLTLTAASSPGTSGVVKGAVAPPSLTSGPKLKTVTLTGGTSVPVLSTGQVLAPVRTLPFHPPIIAGGTTRSQTVLTPQSIGGAQLMTTIKPTAVTRPTLILANASQSFIQAPIAGTQKKDIMILDPGQKATNEVKFHVLPVINTPQAGLKSVPIKSTALSVDAINERNKSVVTQPFTSTTFTVPAQVVIDHATGNLVKLPTNSNFGTQVSSPQTQPSFSLQTLPGTLLQSVQTASNVRPGTSKADKPTIPIIIGGKAFNVDISRLMKPAVTTSGADSGKPVSVHLPVQPINISQSHMQTLVTPNKPSITVTAQKPAVPTTTTTKTEKPTITKTPSVPVISSPASLLPITTSQAKKGQSSSIVLDFQQALQAHKLTGGVDSLPNTASGAAGPSTQSQDSANVKPLAEMCKRYLSHLFSTLDKQTSESDDDSPLVSPKPKTEQLASPASSQLGEGIQINWQERLMEIKKETIAEENKDVSGSVVENSEELVCPPGEEESQVLVKTEPEVSLNTSVSETASTASSFQNLPEFTEPTILLQTTQVSSESTSACGSENLDSNNVNTSQKVAETESFDCGEAAITQSISETETHGVGDSATSQSVTETEELHDTYSNKMLMDPTAPLAIGEIPLFACSKGDSDSHSPGSE